MICYVDDGIKSDYDEALICKLPFVIGVKGVGEVQC